VAVFSRSLARRTAVAVVAVAALVACNDERSGDAEVFCTELEADAPVLMNPQLATADDVAAHLAVYEGLAQSVPLAIEEEWDALVGAYRTAAEVVPGDSASVEVARREIFTSEQSALTVRDWVTANCGFDLASVGPIGTLSPATTPIPTTTPGG
jgi:hypothetical protein